MVGSNFYRLLLKLKKLVSKILWNAISNNSFPRLLGKVVSHFDVDMVRGNRFWPCPTLVDDVYNILGYVETPLVAPSVVEPSCQLFAGIAVRHIDVQFALFRQTCKGQIAASQEANDRTYRVVSKEQVEFCVQRMTKGSLTTTFFAQSARQASSPASSASVGAPRVS